MAGEEELNSFDPALKDLGSRILAAADDVQLLPEAALWALESDDEGDKSQAWRFYLATSLLDEKGPLGFTRKYCRRHKSRIARKLR
jgi:hypothetical protein